MAVQFSDGQRLIVPASRIIDHKRAEYFARHLQPFAVGGYHFGDAGSVGDCTRERQVRSPANEHVAGKQRAISRAPLIADLGHAAQWHEYLIPGLT